MVRKRSFTFKSIQILEPLSLLHIRVQYERAAVKQTKDRVETTNAVLAVREDERATGELSHEVVQIQVLVMQSAHESSLGQRRRRSMPLCQVNHLRLLTDAHSAHQRL